MRICTITVVVLSAALCVSGAHAQDRKVEQAIKHRRAAFVLMSTYFSRLLQTVEGDRPFDTAQVAKEDIWLDEDHFKRLAADLQTRTATLSKAAATGQMAPLKSAFESTRNACNDCHKAFRKK